MSSATDRLKRASAARRGERGHDHEQPTAQAGAGRADHEGDDLGAGDVVARELRGDLVVAHGAERPPVAAAHEVREQHEGDECGEACDPAASARAEVSPSDSGGVGGATVSPLLPPRKPEKRDARAG